MGEGRGQGGEGGQRASGLQGMGGADARTETEVYEEKSLETEPLEREPLELEPLELEPLEGGPAYVEPLDKERAYAEVYYVAPLERDGLALFVQELVRCGFSCQRTSAPPSFRSFPQERKCGIERA